MNLMTDATERVVTGYRTEESLFATRYKQGGRTVYAIALTPDQIVNLVPRPDPAAENPGNRRITPKHAQDFANYFIKQEEWVSPGIILRAPSVFSFEPTNSVAGAEFGVLSYPKRAQGDIHILDGQHRILGFHIAIQILDDDLDKARSQKVEAKRAEGNVRGPLTKEAERRIRELEAKRERFYTERVTVEVQVTDDMQVWRQMFYDIAENAQGITASVKARFDTRKVVNRSLPTVFKHPLLEGRVDMEVDRLSRQSPHVLSARHVMETVRTVNVGLEGRVTARMDKEMNETDVAARAIEFFDILVAAFPQYHNLVVGQLTAERLRSLSLLGSPLFVRVLAGVFYELRAKHAFSNEMIQDYFAALSKHVALPIHENTIWMEHAPEGTFVVGALSPNGRRQDSRALMQAIVDWAVIRAPFVYEDPKPAPVPVIDTNPEGLSDTELAAFDALERAIPEK
ncbi:DNA sulfur modification protein DndB [Agromyces larvae]|uniref:DGQHR domain-containing protein n=1 Tax=Agromyces larvae TaxID=2929802 RepID=A0ABY4C6C4_9MICO|nr:DNA sulfur modification protein DndB [Agromyces larvae]UOE45977.1 hypothetical protein MTO99_09610 [Agromyces larvae]